MCPRVAPRARRTPISVRRSSTPITMTFAMPMPPTSRATPPSPRSRAVSVSLTASFAARRVGRVRDVDLAGRLRVGGGGEDAAHRVEGLRLHDGVDRGRGRIGVERGGGGRIPDERGSIERGVERDRVEDPDHGEALVADLHLAPVRRVDPQALGRGGAEHHGGEPGGGAVEPAPGGDRGADGVEQVDLRSQDRDPSGLGLGDDVAASDGGVDPVTALACWIASRRRIRGGRVGQGDGAAGERLARLHLEPVVPRASSCTMRSARLDCEIPITATSAAMPMAMPMAVSTLRSRRVRGPTRARPTTSRGRTWLRSSGPGSSDPGSGVVTARRSRSPRRPGRRGPAPRGAAGRRSRGRG